jgi:glycosyltransferase involved in cell wall biosynthesis
MKILQVSHGLPPREIAGVELYTFHLSEALIERNHQVSVFCRAEDPQREEFSTFREDSERLRVTRVVNNLAGVSDRRAYYDNPFFDQVFSEALKRERPDLVHIQHLFGLSGHLVWVAKKEGIPVVFTLHDFFTLCERIQLLKQDRRLCAGPLYGLECVSCLDSGSTPRDRRTRFFLRFKDQLPFPVVKWTKRFFIPPKFLNARGYEVFCRYRYMFEVFKRCNLLLTPSQYVKDFFLKYYSSMKSKFKVLPLGILPVPHPNRSKTTDEKMRFCYFGNILPIKGLHVLIDAFKALPQGKATLTIYGARTPWTANYYDTLKDQALGFPADFRGPYQRENLSQVLKDQDVVILPAIWPETFSIVIREAHMLGLPVIASRIGAIPEAVEEGRNGLLFEPGNPEDLKRCMLRLIEEPGLLQTMSKTMPTIKTMAEHAQELEAIYERIIKENNKEKR